MCARCHTTTQRNYRAGFLFFTSVGGLFTAAAPFIAFEEYRDSGLWTAIESVVLLLLGAALSAGAGLAIRYFGSKGHR